MTLYKFRSNVRPQSNYEEKYFIEAKVIVNADYHSANMKNCLK